VRDRRVDHRGDAVDLVRAQAAEHERVAAPPARQHRRHRRAQFVAGHVGDHAVHGGQRLGAAEAHVGVRQQFARRRDRRGLDVARGDRAAAAHVRVEGEDARARADVGERRRRVPQRVQAAQRRLRAAVLAAAEGAAARHHQLDAAEVRRPLDPRRPHQEVGGDEDRPVGLEAGDRRRMRIGGQFARRDAVERQRGHGRGEPDGQRVVAFERALHVGVHVQPVERRRRVGTAQFVDARRRRRHAGTPSSCSARARIASGSTMRPIAS
jgi:hypothetical protein